MRKLKLLSCGVAASLAALGCASAYAQDDAPTTEVQVVGSATIEKPAEVFRIEVQIVERARTQIAALAAASEKLEEIRSGIEGLDGLTSYKITSDTAAARVARPYGCEFDGYGDERPEDCSPIEIGALLYFTLEGTPAASAGAAVAYLAEAGVESVNLQEFDVADRAAAELEAKQAALADAIATAQALAAQAGVEIGRPTLIRYGDSFSEPFFGSERIVVTGSRITRPPPQVQLELSPPPVPFSASVATTFEIQ